MYANESRRLLNSLMRRRTSRVDRILIPYYYINKTSVYFFLTNVTPGKLVGTYLL